MGGFGGVSLDQYDAIPDHVLRDSYFAERDEDHHLITLRQRRKASREGRTETGNPDRAGRELPPRAELNIPDEAWFINPTLRLSPQGQSWVMMFWQVFRRRQREGVLTEAGEPISDAYILERFTKAAGEGAPRRHGRSQ